MLSKKQNLSEDTPGSKRHVNIWVTGRVQGVFFRVKAKEKAEELGVAGFVRNEPDGSVYIEAEGGELALRQFMQWCRKGSEMAEVANVSSESAPLQEFDSFEIR